MKKIKQTEMFYCMYNHPLYMPFDIVLLTL